MKKRQKRVKLYKVLLDTGKFKTVEKAGLAALKAALDTRDKIIRVTPVEGYETRTFDFVNRKDKHVTYRNGKPARIWINNVDLDYA